MRAVIVYESMYGNTRLIAERVAQGLSGRFTTTISSVSDATDELVTSADLLVCGGPTHVHGLSRPSTRRAAIQNAPMDTEVLTVAADGPGLREWLDRLPRSERTMAATFDTRATGPALLTGRASRGIARRLRQRGYVLPVAAESFVVDKHNHLEAGEDGRAELWGAFVAASAAAAEPRVEDSPRQG
jgi:flavodoxin